MSSNKKRTHSDTDKKMSSNSKRTCADPNHTNETKTNSDIGEYQLGNLPEVLLNRSFSYLNLIDRTGVLSVSNNIIGVVRPADKITIDKPLSPNTNAEIYWDRLSKKFSDISELTYIPEIEYKELIKILPLWPNIRRIHIEHLRLKNMSFIPATNDVLRINQLTLEDNPRRPFPTLPEHVKKLTLSRFDRPVDDMKLPKKLTHLEFDVFDRTVSFMSFPKTLKNLSFGYEFNQNLDYVSFPIGLTHLKFGHSFNQGIEYPVTFPESLTHLKFGDSFNQKIVYFPKSLTHLKFGRSFGRSLVESLGRSFKHNIGKLASLKNLTHLTLKGFNQEIGPGALPEGLTHLTLGPYFEHNFGLGVLPQSLTHLYLSNDFARDQIDNCVFPPMLVHLTLVGFTGEIKCGFLSQTNLKSLVLGSEFNKEIKKNRLPASLTHLTLGRDFNNAIILPGKLTHLSLGRNFNRPISFVNEGLTHLTFDTDSSFDQVIGEKDLPNSLTHLYFGYDYNQELKRGVLKHNLKHLEFGFSYNQNILANVLPSSLTHLTIGGFFNKAIAKLPVSLTHLKIDQSLQDLIFDSVVPGGVTHITVGTYNLERHRNKEVEKYLDKIVTTSSLPVSLKKIIIRASKDHVYAARRFLNEYELLPNRWSVQYDLGEITLTKY